MSPEASMINQDWLVDGQGNCLALDLPELTIPEQPYRLYRFLTELEDILNSTEADLARLPLIVPLVRKLLVSSYWLQWEFDPPSVNPGWSVRFLYQEQDFLLTVQNVCWLPGSVSPIHNHGTWGIVAILDGQEKNQLWRRSPTPTEPNSIKLVGERILSPGDIIAFVPETIHSVTVVGDEPTVSFNLYGVTNFSQRFEFDPIKHTIKNF